jgi:hypothetical protein
MASHKQEMLGKYLDHLHEVDAVVGWDPYEDDDLGWGWNPFKSVYKGVRSVGRGIKRGTKAIGTGLKDVALMVPQALSQANFASTLSNGNLNNSESGHAPSLPKNFTGTWRGMRWKNGKIVIPPGWKLDRYGWPHPPK